MINKINLVPKEVNRIRNIGRTLTYLKMVSRAVAVGLALIVVLEYAWVFQIQNQLKKTNEQIDSLQATLQEQFPVEIKYLQDQRILQQANVIITKRKNYQGVLSSLYALLPSDVALSSLSFSNRVLIISTLSKDVQSMSTLFANVQKLGVDKSKVFGDIAMTDNKRNESGQYNTSWEIELLNAL